MTGKGQILSALKARLCFCPATASLTPQAIVTGVDIEGFAHYRTIENGGGLGGRIGRALIRVNIAHRAQDGPGNLFLGAIGVRSQQRP